jgi:thiol:disulfide interchange protein/DsbC/DsbD-like thiol-disulfide interchange protein
MMSIRDNTIYVGFTPTRCRFSAAGAAFSWLLGLVASSLAAEPGAAQRSFHVEAQLVAETSHIVAGQPFRVGLVLRHDELWHTYWKTTATGYATSIEWQLPPGFEAGSIDWPRPKVYLQDGYVEYTYEQEVLLPVTLIAPPDLQPGSLVRLQAVVEWLMCEKVCIPGQVELALDVMVGEEDPAPYAETDTLLWLWAAQNKPLPADESMWQAWVEGDYVILRGPAPRIDAETPYFFDDQSLIKPQQTFADRPTDPGHKELLLPIDPAGIRTAARLTGVLSADSGWDHRNGHPALALDIPLLAGPPRPAVEAEPASGLAAMGSWLGLMALAFAGGLVLNLMPCVFPVLGIKVMSFVNQAGADRRRVAAQGLLYTAGVLASFWLLAGLLLVLRAGGEQLGWGFQLQSPAFVYLLAAFLFVFGLNMSGLFEVGQSAVGFGGKLDQKTGASGAFFSGVLATVVATPCAAPFLAPALGAALTLPAATSLLVFTFIALGLALPFLMLSLFPAFARLLPRPGAWMETLKQGMSFLLYATVGFLVWVLAAQVDDAYGFSGFALLSVLLSLVGLAVAAWIYGRWAAFHLPAATRRRAVSATLVVGVLALWTGYPQQAAPLADGEVSLAPVWREWQPGLAEELAAGGEVVYVDFTARWCVTCQTNKAAVFRSSAVLEAIRDRGVVLLKADWTQQDPAITAELAKYGRSAVPFNLVFVPGSRDPRILPEILTPGIVLEALLEQ